MMDAVINPLLQHLRMESNDVCTGKKSPIPNEPSVFVKQGMDEVGISDTDRPSLISNEHWQSLTKKRMYCLPQEDIGLFARRLLILSIFHFEISLSLVFIPVYSGKLNNIHFATQRSKLHQRNYKQISLDQSFLGMFDKKSITFCFLASRAIAYAVCPNLVVIVISTLHSLTKYLTTFK
jgi:hypothetical protein